MRVASAAIMCAALSIAAPDGEANDVGWYVGGAFGLARKDTPSTEFDLFAADVHAFFGFTPSTQQISFDDGDESYSFLIGYRLTRYLAIEGSYGRFGKLSYRSRATGDFPMDSGTLNSAFDSETTGFSLAALGILPLTYNWEVYGRVGVLFASNEISVRLDAVGDVFISPVGQRLSQSFSQSSDDSFAAVGIGYRFFDIYDLRLEYQRIFDAGLDVTMNAGDLDVASLGLTVTF